MASVPAQQSAAKAHILVVEDSPSIRRRVQHELEEAGYRVSTANTGEEALTRTLEQSFDLVVSDIEMGAITGVQLCRVLRSDPGTSHLPIVLLTAAKDSKTRFWGRNAGADIYLNKENMQDELVDAVAELLDKHPDRASIHPQITGTPLERLSRVLDRNLFEAVVQSEVRRFMDHVHDRKEFAARALSLIADVTDSPYLMLVLHGPGGPTYTVHARGVWPKDDPGAGFLGVGIPKDDFARVETIIEPSDRFRSSEFSPGAPLKRRISVRGEALGELVVFSGAKQFATSDAGTAELFAESLGVVLKSMFLMEETQLLALTDGLTGLYNRRHAAERLDQEISRSLRGRSGLCVALIDIDHFKAINDEYGHGAGDRVLREIAKTLMEFVRLSDVVARWGGEEFLVVFPDTQLAAARVVAERLRARLANMDAVADGPDQVTASIGLATLVEEMDAHALVELADQALYRAKARGRNRVEVASSTQISSVVMQTQVEPD